MIMIDKKVDRLEQDYYDCETIIKEYSKSFYYAFSQLPRHDANAVYAIYAFCRKADDSVDKADNIHEKKVQLRKLEKEVSAFLDGIPQDTPMWRALDDVKQRYKINGDMLKVQLEGQRMDVDFKQPADIEELIEYCKYVAGSVGCLLLPILSDNVDNQRYIEAEKLGVAMQITNILRDVGEDCSNLNRIYLPVSLMKDSKYTKQDLEQSVINEAFINVWETLAETAENLYDDFVEELKYYKVEARLPLLISLNVYKELLNEVRNHQYDCFSKKHAVTKARKLYLKKVSKKYIQQHFKG